jgi:PAS domain S-box-containing protein
MTDPDSPAATAAATLVPVEASILLVDDRPEDLIALETVLSDPRYRLVTARSGKEALMRVLREDFAVILLDAHMPGMDGFEVASIIKQRERSRHTPILFLTAGAADMRAIYKAYSVGAVDYLVKPIDRDVVRAKVAIFVDLFEKDQRIRQQGLALQAAERRQRELELTQERLAGARRYRALAEAIPQIVWTANPDGSLHYFNQRWYQYTGLDHTASMGWGWTSALHPDDVQNQLERWRDALARTEVYEAECRIRGVNQEYRWHLMRAVPDFSADGELAGWLGTYTDCDDLKRANFEAQQAIRVRDEFLSIASHELRTPLTALQLQLESLASMLPESQGSLGPRLIKAVRQTDRLGRLIGNLLDVSRIMSGKLELDLEAFDFSDLVREVVDSFAEEATRARCKITLQTDTACGRWDRLRMEQVVTNLLSNSLKYAPGAEVEIRLEVGDVARLTVSDHGIGIAPEALSRIFGRFERAAPSRHYGGLGVGLYITRQIVSAHGGTIRVDSQLGKGSTFTVELPIAARATGVRVASHEGTDGSHQRLEDDSARRE